VADLHRSKRSSAWGPPDSRGPQIYKKKICEKSKIQGPLVKINGVWGPTITVAWGLTRPKSGPASNNKNKNK